MRVSMMFIVDVSFRLLPILYSVNLTATFSPPYIYLTFDRTIEKVTIPWYNGKKKEGILMDFAYLKSKRILLVDDEQALLDLVVSILQNDGYQNITTAKSVSEAVTLAKEIQPELAILDVMLPDGNGFELMERLKQIADYPVLFLTARGEDEDKFRGFGLGADDYVVKPFLPKELLFRVTAILRRTYKEEKTLVALKGSEIDFSRAEVIKDGVHIPLTANQEVFPARRFSPETLSLSQ